ncbi:uncharacterized protein LOC135169456 [Diachasmimorpha longicaudata]|uniref:uncharacterized protein LOC135169456 n=1 Tax=Diachasmimorpha longicaudata TaxID=58733 RepID=UPI0030B88B16
MSSRDRKRRSRSRSRDERSHKRMRSSEKFRVLQNQLDNLTQVVNKLVEVRAKPAVKDLTNLNEIIEIDDKENNSSVINDDTNPSQAREQVVNSEDPTHITVSSSREAVLKALGVDVSFSKLKEVTYNSELMKTWSKWTKEGLPAKNKKDIVDLYNRKGELYVEAPKVNLEILPLLSDMAKKRDSHFVDTQNCVGTALAALGAAVSLMVDPPEEGLDEDVFTDYLSHTGQMLADIFYQQTVARKSFITPLFNKTMKPTVDTMLTDEWLYGENLKEKVKTAKEIERASSDIKDKPPQKNAPRTRLQGNSKNPPANARQVGYHQQRHRLLQFRKTSYKSASTNRPKTNPQTSQSSSKK